MTTVLGVVPNEEVRKWAYRWAARTCFRILSRSFSAVISFHDTQYRPQSDGICVANHTTPIDVVILQNDQTYALVSCHQEQSRSDRQTLTYCPWETCWVRVLSGNNLL